MREILFRGKYLRAGSTANQDNVYNLHAPSHLGGALCYPKINKFLQKLVDASKKILYNKITARDNMIHGGDTMQLKEIRVSTGWSQEFVARKINVSRQSIKNWEDGKSIPDTDKALKLAELFGTTVENLFKEYK